MTAPTAPMTVVTEPGVYDLPEELYHADPVPAGSLSSSGARRLLPPSCPALFRHEQQHGRPDTKAFDFGKAAHRQVLGTGSEVVVFDYPDWKTKKARDDRDVCRSEGLVPLLDHEMTVVEEMATALRAHPAAAALFGDGGQPEQSLFWVDRPSGIWRRARLDWYPVRRGARLIVPDYKTSVSADLDAIQRSAWSFGWAQQAAWYLDGIEALGLAGDAKPAFLFVVQEKAAPYLVSVIELDQVALDIGRRLNRQAINVYRECSRSGHWPAYSDDIELISLPGWVENKYSEDYR
ncbi:PD-(D/E)XK nuclease-like domain-containing protein [Frankia sp. Mgl5]|uniref:PD-(D/E)XK nuclease-like domain-containing protein n=1 Tax=Frankia sp. Mgl5 TaxID=2933793 RepID=UPI00200D1EF0|nr:PD-(D/E)XK nuclease-like domain-containing protein [Frankia sp. Mgl5]MCK9929999.1 PD-(D/E)XK nuclease-like domain-containing protein [Frankia sp. Mgl5]